MQLLHKGGHMDLMVPDAGDCMAEVVIACLPPQHATSQEDFGRSGSGDGETLTEAVENAHTPRGLLPCRKGRKGQGNRCEGDGCIQVRTASFA
ncbi:hypothetical protein NDU88_002119 [Pleurodeles waltl]|uniref:Uncharacterized protein n=1 Tax=Pleurodeles waltl TaxID=8319 RepID=A0AAV7SCT9_PLEWA|nr:hypothetical protein NDU88_002119 [Pleurodeles waltl]